MNLLDNFKQYFVTGNFRSKDNPRKRVRFEDEDNVESENVNTRVKRRKTLANGTASASAISNSADSGSRARATPSQNDGDDDFDVAKWQSLLHRVIVPDNSEGTRVISSDTNSFVNTARSDATSCASLNSQPQSFRPSSSNVPSSTSSRLFPPNVDVPSELTNWPLVIYTLLNEPSIKAGTNATPVRNRLRRHDSKRWPEVLWRVLQAENDLADVSNAGSSSRSNDTDMSTPGASGSGNSTADDGCESEESEEEWSEESDEDIDEVLALKSDMIKARLAIEDGDDLYGHGQWEPSLLQRPSSSLCLDKDSPASEYTRPPSDSSNLRLNTSPKLMHEKKPKLSNPLHFLGTYRCPICLSPPIKATLTPCGHITCARCLWMCIKASGYEPPLDDEVGDVIAAGGGVELFRDEENQFQGYTSIHGAEGDSWVHGDMRDDGSEDDDPGPGWRWRYRIDLNNVMNGDGRMGVWRERVRDQGKDKEPRCPICRAIIPA
ncbi:hypothetical protein VKT23_016092 [Stygiomarasmius scandens]|uniref:RING-type domain-containing protein n=1 Tax=Marasmiellus scandens TaxID=2682957 RepID=A0ABR1IY13_9AGAR